MTVVTECKHHWDIGSRRREGDVLITPERCRLCGGEHELIEKWNAGWKHGHGNPDTRHYTEIRYPNGKPEIKEDTTLVTQQEGQEVKDQGGGEQTQEKPESQGKGGNTTNMRDYYEQNKEAILADYAYMGFSATARKWKIPSGSMSGLLRRWGVETTKSKNRQKKEKGKGVLSAAEKSHRDTPPGIDAEDNFTKSREIEAHADEIIADIDSGMMIKKICSKWNISRKAFENFRRRHGLVVGINKPKVDIIAIVDQIFDEETDIKAAKQRWYGAKSVIQMMRIR